MSVYLDSGVLIAFLFSETEPAEMVQPATRLFAEIKAGRVIGICALYALPELYGYVVKNYSPVSHDEIFRASLVELLSYPLALKPFVERMELERLRRRIKISDSYDSYHVAVALHYQCSAIITFDHHFDKSATSSPFSLPTNF